MKKAILLVAVGLAFIGAGCLDQAAEEAVSPIASPLGALDYAETTIGNVNQTTQQRAADQLGDRVMVAMLKLENSDPSSFAELGGTIGCNDRIAYVMVPRLTQTGYAGQDALASLFIRKELNYDETYNALSNSSLKVDKVVSNDGAVTDVFISGTLSSNGACDDPRVKAQIEETVRLYHPNFRIYLNGTESAWRCFGNMSGLCQ